MTDEERVDRALSYWFRWRRDWPDELVARHGPGFFDAVDMLDGPFREEGESGA